MSPADVDRFVDELYVPMVRARRQMQQAALDLVEQTTGSRPQVSEFPYPKGWLKGTIEQEIQKPWNNQITADGAVDKAIRTDIGKGVVQGVAENAARYTIIRSSNVVTNDDDNELSVGYASMIQGEKTCPFCLMLASRGPVYSEDQYDKSEVPDDGRAGRLAKWHTNCDCILVPVVRSRQKQWGGYAEYKKLEDLWVKVSRARKGRSQLHAWYDHFNLSRQRGLNPLTAPPQRRDSNTRSARAA